MMEQTYLALGDSYTIGEQVATEDNFPNQVVRLVNEALVGKYKISTPRIIATTGWTTDELAAGIQAAEIKDAYDWVSLLIGVNNQYRGRSVAEYAKEFEQLLQQAITFANGNKARVIVVSIPDWGCTPFAAEKNPTQIAIKIDAYNQSNAEIAHQYQVHYVDITPLSRTQGNVGYLVEDLLHYNAKAYAQWATLIADIVIEQYRHEQEAAF